MLYTYFLSTYVCIYLRIKALYYLTDPTQPFKLLMGVDIIGAQEHWSQAHSTHYHFPVYSTCLDGSTDTALS